MGCPSPQLGWLAINSRRNAALNPEAVLKSPITMEDYLDARMVSSPFGLLDCDIPVDGSIAVVVSHADPIKAYEYLAAGLPVVASGVGGVLEIVRQGETGLIVPPGDPAALASAVCRLMADASFAHHLGDAARAEVTGRYSFDRMIDEFEAVYLTELARGGHLPLPQPELAAS